MAAPRTKKPAGGSATPNPVHKPLDALDRDILTELVRDGRIPNNVLAERLGLARGEWVVTFQSRFGKAQWLQPYTEPTLEQLARDGVRTVDVVCPGFVADCLETLEEIAIEAKGAFQGAGGSEFRYHACLNDAPEFVDALAGLVERQCAGWPTVALGPEDSVRRDRALVDRRARAVALGAPG